MIYTTRGNNLLEDKTTGLIISITRPRAHLRTRTILNRNKVHVGINLYLKKNKLELLHSLRVITKNRPFQLFWTWIILFRCSLINLVRAMILFPLGWLIRKNRRIQIQKLLYLVLILIKMTMWLTPSGFWPYLKAINECLRLSKCA
jgi:hypothetical protein